VPLVVLERISSTLLEASNISCSLTLRSIIRRRQLAQSSCTLLIFSLSSLGTPALTTYIEDRTNCIQTLTLSATKVGSLRSSSHGQVRVATP